MQFLKLCWKEFVSQELSEFPLVEPNQSIIVHNFFSTTIMLLESKTEACRPQFFELTSVLFLYYPSLPAARRKGIIIAPLLDAFPTG